MKISDGRQGHRQKKNLLYVLPLVGSDNRWCLRCPTGKLVIRARGTSELRPLIGRPWSSVAQWLAIFIIGGAPGGMGNWDERTNKQRDYLFTWLGGALGPGLLNDLIAHVCTVAGIPRYTSHQFRHTLAVQWRKNGMHIETISRMLGHKSLSMTLRYAAIMPETVRKEFDMAFAAIDREHRTTAQVRVYLSPEAHVAASQQWREALWVDLGIGFCGLSAYLPCEDRLACLPCPNFIPTKENLPLYSRQRDNLVEISVLGERLLPTERKREIHDAVELLEKRIADISGKEEAMLVGRSADNTLKVGDEVKCQK